MDRLPETGNSSLARAAYRDGLRGYASFIGFSLLVGLLALLSYQWIDRTVQNRFTDLVLQTINRDWADSGWRIHADRVERIDQVGVRFIGLALYAPEQNQPALRCHQVLVHAACELTDLLSKKVCPQRIEISDGLVVYDLQRATGDEWAAFIAFLESKRRPEQPRPQISIRRSTLQIEQLHPEHPTLVFRDVSLEQVTPHSPQAVSAWQGMFSWSDSAKLVGRWEWLVDSTWTAALEFQQLPLHHQWMKFVPQQWREPLRHLQHLEGKLSGQIYVQSAQPGRTWQFSSRLEARDLWCQDQRFPHPLLDGHAIVVVDQDGWKLESLTGKIGESPLQLTGWQAGWLADSPRQWSGSLKEFSLRDEWVVWLPPVGQNIYRDLEPAGHADLHFWLQFDGQRWKKDLRADFKDLAFRYRKFPFRLSGCIGNARWIDDEVNFSVQALENSQLIALDGQINSPGPQATFQVNFRCDGRLPINDKLFQSLKTYPKVAEQVMALRAQGHLGVQGRFLRTDPQLPPRLDFDVALKDCSVRHLRFDYPVRNLEGIIQVRDQKFTLKNMVGMHQRSKIVCEGGWSATDGLDLRFLADQVYLEQSLKNALAPAWQQLWNQLRPQGAVHLARVDLRQLPDQTTPSVNLEVTIDPPAGQIIEAPLAINMAAFPYPLQQIQGQISVADGKIELRDLRAKHERVWLTAAATGAFNQEAWQLQFHDVMVGALSVDEHLLEAVPDPLEQALRSMKVDGLLQLTGDFLLQGKMLNSLTPIRPANQEIQQVTFIAPPANLSETQSNPAMEMAWNMRVDLNRNRLNLGIPIDEVQGAVLLNGRYDGRSAVCSGQLEIDSVACLGMQFTDIKGPIWIDEGLVAAGQYAKLATAPQSPKPLRGKIMDGVIDLDIQTWFDGERKFYLQTSVNDAQMPQISRRFSPNTPPIKGLASLGLRLAGTPNRTEDLTGEGVMELRETELYELPVVLALLKFLAQPNKGNAAFDSSNVEFTLQGTQVRLNRIKLTGDTISLLGNGNMNWNREIDLNFFTVAGRNRFYIPILSELFEVGSQQILWISVGGTTDQPRATQKILPGLNDTLRQLLDPAGLNSNSPMTPGNPLPSDRR